MKANIWLNNAHASQGDIARLIRLGTNNAYPVLSSHKDYREDILMMAHEQLIEPAVLDDSYVDWALGVARSYDVRAMIAMRGREGLLAARDQFFKIGVRLAAGALDAETIVLCDHKDQFTLRMEELGIPVPRTIAVQTPEQLRAAIADIEQEGEACVKPVLGVYGNGYWRFQRDKSLFDVFAGKSHHTIDPEVYIDAYARAEERRPLIVMEHLPGDEYSVDCVCDAGELVAQVRRRKVGTYQEISTMGVEVEIARAVVAHLKLDGLVNIQTRADRNGNPKVLEVNTRPSGGVGYAAAAGVNLPAIAARVLLGEESQFFNIGNPKAVRIGEDPFVLYDTSRMLLARDIA